MSARVPDDPGRGARASGPQGTAARLIGAWRAMHTEQRLAASAALGLFVTMLLPWYTKTDVVDVQGTVHPTQSTFTAFGAFSFVEAAVLLVSVFVIVVVFARAEGREFHLPGGDGTIIMLAGAWAALLIFYRLFAKPTLQHTAVITATEGVTWGIFVAVLVALLLGYAGWRMRLAARPEPPLVLPARDAASRAQAEASERDAAPITEIRTPGAGERPRRPPRPPSDRPRAPNRRAVTREDAAQLSFDDPPSLDPFGADDKPVARRPR